MTAVYVDMVYQNDHKSPFLEKLIEKLTLSEQSEVKKNIKESDIKAGRVSFSADKSEGIKKDTVRLKIARRAAR